MRVIIDCRLFTYRATGVTTYLIDSIRAICQNLPDWKLILAAPKKFHDSIVGLPTEKLRIVVSPLLGIEKMPYRIWAEIEFPRLAYKYHADILWGPAGWLPRFVPSGCKTLLTIHDVVSIEYFDTMSKHAQMVTRLFGGLKESVNKADMIWCNSKYTSCKVNEYFPQRKTKDVVIGDSCNTEFRNLHLTEQAKEAIKTEFKIKKEYLLFVGSLEPRKNLTFLLEIMPEIYRQTGFQLLIVGAKGWKNSNVFEIVNHTSYPKEAVIFANYVSFEKLVSLYNAAILYISTAKNEGFGMPQLEAMSCGCPVVSPHNSAMIEVVSQRGITIKGWDNETWINTIVSLLQNDERLKLLKNPDISEYNWDNIIMRVNTYIKSKLLLDN